MNVGFSCNFLDYKTENHPQPKMYKPFFIEYDSAKWRAGSGGGAFKYFDGKGIEYALIISEDSRFGIMLIYEKWDENQNKSIGSWYSVSQLNQLSQFVTNEDELDMPKGSYMKPVDAWDAVSGFLENPCSIPRAIQWIDVNDIAWPE